MQFTVMVSDPGTQEAADTVAVSDSNPSGSADVVRPPLPNSERATLSPQPPSIPDHELIRCVGRGAYGEVWLARHAQLGTLRAVKIVRRDHFDDARPFQREFDGIRRYEPISRGHPNLVAILHVGGTDDCFFYVMELADSCEPVISESVISNQRSESVKGSGTAPPLNTDSLITDYSPHTLRSELKQHGALLIDRCVEIGRALAGALAHLHTRGLVHRDVKPSNVIFVGGVTKLADIGLVAVVNESRSFVGTEGYIPPEGPGAPSADCYALGKLLYELSTGHDRTAWPEPPADLATRPDRERLLELNAILHRACAPKRSERYRDAEAMLADLERLVRGKSVRRMHRVEHRWYSVRRGAPWLLLGVGTLALLLLAARLGRPPTDVEAHKRSTNMLANDLYYDVGRSLYLKNTPTDIAKAAEKYQAAVKADTNFALAWAALSAAWSWESIGTSNNFPLLSRAREVADHALAMDDSLSEAHLALATHAYIREWNWPKAEAEYSKAIKCDPTNPQPHEWYGLFLRSLGRTQEALREFELAVNINPHSMTANRFLGNGLISARQYKEAAVKYRKSAELGSGYDFSPDALLWCGEIDGWITANEQSAVASGISAAEAQSQATDLRRAWKEEGDAAFWKKRCEFMRKNGDGLVDLAGACAAAVYTEESLDLLDQAYREHHDWLVWDLTTHPTWDNLRGHPRFQELLRKLNLKPVQK